MEYWFVKEKKKVYTIFAATYFIWTILLVFEMTFGNVLKVKDVSSDPIF